jgi:predicted ribosome quality control (RQC) complex YloA/Tae2 family protein
MYLDFITLAAVREALESHLISARVQSVVQPSPESVVLEVYSGERQYLYLS